MQSYSLKHRIDPNVTRYYSARHPYRLSGIGARGVVVLQAPQRPVPALCACYPWGYPLLFARARRFRRRQGALAYKHADAIGACRLSAFLDDAVLLRRHDEPDEDAAPVLGLFRRPTR